eukprot:3297344-Rhodomonas_salina.1
MPAVTWYHTSTWQLDSQRMAPKAWRTHSPRLVGLAKSVNWVDLDRTRSTMLQWESCCTRRTTSFRNCFHPAGGSGSADGSA